jgi:hypothetical protein
MTKQPEWKLIAQLGDRNPIEHGGYFVYEDTTGVYAPEGELLIPPTEEQWEADNTAEIYETPDYKPKSRWNVYRFSLERCTLTDGILSDNKYHPLEPAWFATPESEKANRPQDTTYLSNIATYHGMTVEQFQTLLISDSPVERAHAYRAIGEFHGFENFGYPLTLTKTEVEARYKGKKLS